MNRICASSCYTHTAYTGQFAYLSTGSGTSKNEIRFCSVQKCAPDNSVTRYESIRLEYGRQVISNLNSSFNHCYDYSSFRVQTPVTFTANFLNIVSNFALHSICVGVGSGSTKSFSSSNIIRNDSPSGNGVYYHNSGHSATFSNSIFYLNYNTLFSKPGGGALNINNCFIQHSSTTTSGTLITYTAVITTNGLTETILISHFSSYYCNPEFQELDLSPCQTLHPVPTSCSVVISNNPVLSSSLNIIFSLLHFGIVLI